jgi:hypothetical protein
MVSTEPAAAQYADLVFWGWAAANVVLDRAPDWLTGGGGNYLTPGNLEANLNGKQLGITAATKYKTFADYVKAVCKCE